MNKYDKLFKIMGIYEYCAWFMTDENINLFKYIVIYLNILSY